MTSATDTVKHAIELLTSIQRLKQDDQDSDEGALLANSPQTLNENTNNLNKYQTTDAVTLMSNITIVPASESNNVGAKRTTVIDRQKYRRPQSGTQSSGPNQRIIDIHQITSINQDNLR
jgi:hypothetical protein